MNGPPWGAPPTTLGGEEAQPARKKRTATAQRRRSVEQIMAGCFGYVEGVCKRVSELEAIGARLAKTWQTRLENGDWKMESGNGRFLRKPGANGSGDFSIFIFQFPFSNDSEALMTFVPCTLNFKVSADNMVDVRTLRALLRTLFISKKHLCFNVSPRLFFLHWH
jgi:hypothetical protein